jgi:hypothetical protein
MPGPYGRYVLIPRACTTLKIFRSRYVLLPRACMFLKIFLNMYVLLPRTGMSLKIFRDRYVLLPRSGMFLNIFHRSEWAQPATVVAGTTGESAALASVRLVGAGTARHWGAWHHSGAALAPARLVGMGPASHWWRALQVRALLCRLLP